MTGRSDVYSLAVVAYEMLTGQPPFQGKTITQVIYRVMHEAPPPPRQWNAALPARYDDVFARALAKDPAARFATAGEFIAALDLRELEFALSEPWRPRRPPATPSGDDSPTIVTRRPAAPRGPRPRRGPRALALAAAGLVALAAASWLVLRRGPHASLPEAARPRLRPSHRPTAPPPTTDARRGDPGPFRASARRPPPRSPRRRLSRPPRLRRRRRPTPTPVVEGQLVELGPGVTRPCASAGSSASYPERARADEPRGSVLISLIVDENGLPTDLQVVESAGPILDEAVLKAVRTWRFEPARKDGVQVKVRWQVRQTYKTAP